MLARSVAALCGRGGERDRCGSAEAEVRECSHARGNRCKSFSDSRCEHSAGQVVALSLRPDGAIFSTGGVAESLDA